MSSFEVEAFRAQFPILNQSINGSPLVYLDNGATTQKPQAVIDCLDQYYQGFNSNVHRGAHELADRATRAFEAARDTVSAFIGANNNELIWTRGTTEAINLIAHSWGRVHLSRGDKVMITEMEHHSNIVPWQLLAQQIDIEVIAIPVTAQGELDMAAFEQMLDESVKLVCCVHVSNALGTVNPVEHIIAKAHAVGAKVLIDGAQAVGHFPVDVKALDADFYVSSSHKIFGPTGVGFAYGKYDILDSMMPYQGGGEMIETVSLSGSTFQAPPLRFEAGTPDISGVIAFAAAVSFIQQSDREAMLAHEHDVLDYAHQCAAQTVGMTVIGQSSHKEGVMSFLLDGAHPHDVGTLLDRQGVAVRTGHHCCQPLMAKLGIPGTVRASFSAYNTRDDVDRLFAAIEKTKAFL
ncbi:MAG: cysteine desulfurase [Gammaproteobacteria bacterium]|nr:cysteine desulfurase [Gammaproteobacteria bacterium]